MEWTIVRLVVSESDGCRHNSEMEPHERTIETPSRTPRQSKTLCLEKTTLRVRVHVQTVGLNAEKKNGRLRAEGEIFGEIFFLDIPSYRTLPIIRVVSMGRRNTWVEPELHWKQRLNRLPEPDEPEDCPG